MNLVEKLRKFRDEYRRCIHPDNCSERGADLIDDCVVIAMKHSDWVSVSERLPSESGEYLVYCVGDVAFAKNRRARTVMVFNAEKNMWASLSPLFKVTHWQPLPQPPSEVQDDK